MGNLILLIIAPFLFTGNNCITGLDTLASGRGQLLHSAFIVIIAATYIDYSTVIVKQTFYAHLLNVLLNAQ